MIVCLGTTPTVQRTMTFDRLAIDSVNRAKSVRQFASGKSINAARVSKTLAEDVIATGFLGGESGKFMRLDLDRAQINHDFVEVAAPTRLCLTLLDESQSTATELIEEPGAVDRSDVERLLAKLSTLLPRCDVLLMSGTLAPGVGEDFYAKCVRLAGQDVISVVDAKGPALSLALRERPMVVKPNRSELAATVGMAIDSDDALPEAMRAVLKQGAKWVLVTNGAQDTWVSNGESFWRMPTPKVAVKNPIGSGDSMAGGIAAGIVGQLSMRDAFRLGVACAAANAMTADAGHVDRKQVDAILKKVCFEEVTRS